MQVSGSSVYIPLTEGLIPTIDRHVLVSHTDGSVDRCESSLMAQWTGVSRH